MAWKPLFVRLVSVLLCSIAVFSSGCREDEPIRHYLAPKESMPEQPLTRMLAVMVPRGKEVWFFKFLASQKEVTRHEADFDALLRSVRFKDQKETSLLFDVPAGWRRQSGSGMRYATLRFGPKSGGLEITITKLDSQSKAADVRANVDRWREQLSLPPLDDEAFGKLHDNIKVDGVAATRVDLLGTRKDDAAAMKMPPHRERPKRDAFPFKYQTPDGWEAQPALEKQGILIPLVFRIRASGAEAEMTAMSLPRDGGGLEMNVNRWRRQLGLAPQSEAQIGREARILKVGDRQALYVDLSGPGAESAKRILGVLLPQGQETWFFTLKGPSQLVGKEQAHFEAFITSLRGEAGAAHE